MEELTNAKLRNFFLNVDSDDNSLFGNSNSFLSTRTKRELIQFLEISANTEKYLINRQDIKKDIIDKYRNKKNARNCTTYEQYILCQDILSDLVISLWRNLLIDALKRLDDICFSNNQRKTILFQESDNVKKLSHYLEEFRRFEVLLYGSNPYYRDHIYHLIWVFLVWVYIFQRFGVHNAIKQRRPWYSPDILAEICVIS